MGAYLDHLPDCLLCHLNIASLYKYEFTFQFRWNNSAVGTSHLFLKSRKWCTWHGRVVLEIGVSALNKLYLVKYQTWKITSQSNAWKVSSKLQSNETPQKSNQKPHGLCGNLVYHHTPDCNECFFFILPNDRLVCVGYDAMVKRAK